VIEMLRRTVARGVIGIAFVALAAAPGTLVISPPIASAQTAIAAGEDDTPPPTDTQPTTPAPVPMVPAPPAPTTPPPSAPAPKPKPRKTQRATPRRTTKRASQLAALPTLVQTSTTDTQTFPQGGVQAGEGGTAPHGPSGPLLGLGSGALAFGLVAAVQARRRRSSER
jgi:hypothetical protein